MPCNSSHLEPTQHETESRKLMNLLAEVGLYVGDVPYYGSVNELDNHTKLLCAFCQENDVTKYSLELQIWWRDHKKADSDKAAATLAKAKNDAEREQALAKLTPHERNLLGL